METFPDGNAFRNKKKYKQKSTRDTTTKKRVKTDNYYHFEF